MKERNIFASDIINVLTFGQVTLEEYKRDLVWRAEGVDLDGCRLTVEAFAFEEAITIKIVTAF
ncbi:MAG: DUF4258 domain-containing protein [Rhodomicrobium sp.]|nr:DUF4258 domain-containing protein [Rhodomicrobium sp.]